jgi:hypothetical protein|tara:strand:- start:20363 stop:22540 length:2178 start_codon:yes stop_codon:yes gene_type:complete
MTIYVNGKRIPERRDDDVEDRYGSGNDVYLGWETADADAHYLNLAVLGPSRNIIISEDRNIDWGHATSTNPRLWIHSADSTDTADWISLYHNQADGVIDTGNGDILFASHLRGNDAQQLKFGSTSDVRMAFNTADGNANSLCIQLPAGDAINVPVMVVGEAGTPMVSADLTLFNGITDPTIAILDQTNADYLRFYHNGSDGYIDTNNGDIIFTPGGTDLRVFNDVTFSWGNTADARLVWETADADANAFILALPDHAGGGVDVPVFAIGDQRSSAILNNDLGLFDGITNPTLALVDTTNSSYLRLYHNGTDAVIDTNTGTINVLDGIQLTFGTDKDWGFDYDEAGDNVLVFSEGTVDTIHIGGSSPSSFAGAGGTSGNDLYWRFQNGGAASPTNGTEGATWTVTLGDGSNAAGAGGGTGGAGGDVKFTVGDGGDGDGAGNAGRGGDFIINLGSEGTGGTPGGHGQFRIERGGFTEHVISAEPGEEVVFNSEGRDIDFRVEGDNVTNLIRTNAERDTVGIGADPSDSGMLVVDRANLSSNMSRRVLDIRGFTQTISGNTGMNHRFNEFSQNTITGAFTVTTASTLYIEDATSLAGGASATTGNYALWVDAGKCRYDGATVHRADAITATGEGVAASITTTVTEITTNGDVDLDNVTLADGEDGQIKIFAVVAVGNAGDSVKITPANMIGGTQITFAASPLGLGCHMYFDSGAGGWVVTGNNGGVIA